MKRSLLLSSLLLCIFLNSFGQATNNTCGTAGLLPYDFGIIPVDGVSNVSTLYNASTTNVGSCAGAARPDIWYKFTTPAWTKGVVIRVSLASFPTSLQTGNTFIELFSNTNCAALTTSGGCNDIGSPRTFALTPSTTYIFRVYTTANVTSGANTTYDVRVALSASADDCANAITMLPGTPIYTGTTRGATSSGVALGTCALGTVDDDVWYKFQAGATNATVSLAGNLTPNGALYVQVFSGPCGALVSKGCGSTPLELSGLVVGDTYYIRVYTATAGGPTGNTAYFDLSVGPLASSNTGSGRMAEVFRQSIITPANVLNNPWEIIYGPDGNLWITEANGYRVYKIDPVTGVRTTVLDLSTGTGTFPGFNNSASNAANAQGGFAGMVFHPKFLKGTNQDYAYVSYVYKLPATGATLVYPGQTNPCRWFLNRIVRFTYNTTTQQFESPVSICDTIPGGNDHNSQRMIIAPADDGKPYLFYAAGDLGAGQLDCYGRTQKAQMINSYEGKILRFKLEVATGDDPLLMDSWIPLDNPYYAKLGNVKSAVWVIGIRNNQGFAYDSTKGLLYGSSHGPYSDDEINVIEPGRNYGHPMVIGYVNDGNYNSADTVTLLNRISAGAPKINSANPPIGSETGQRDKLNLLGNGLYKDPLFSAYAGPASGSTSVKSIWQNNPNNGLWPSEGWSGLDLYNNSIIPGWKKSLVAASLKWGRLVRIKLGPSGIITMPSNDPVNNAGDTISYFGSQNRFRDLAFSRDGRDIYVVMDKSTTTSGPSAQFPVVPTCQGCLQKYTFLGYNVNSGSLSRSYIPTSIPVGRGKDNQCDSVNAVTINAANFNTNLWVPLTDTNSNIVAEIYAMGQDLGRVTASVYHNATGIRNKSGRKYLDRNITITPQFQPAVSTTVKIRIYITAQEYNALRLSSGSGITTFTDLKIVKNSDGCGGTMGANPASVPMDFNTEAFDTSYVLQGTIDHFSTFYIGSASMGTLPVELLSFTGSLQNNTTILNWETSQEINTSYFNVERSIDGNNFTGIGTVTANGNSHIPISYAYNDYSVTSLASNLIYYRLKMVDKDGTYTYSNVVTITLPYTAGKVTVMPNPVIVEARVNMTVTASGRAQWRLSDNSGRVLMQGVQSVRTGSNLLVIDMHSLASGMYYLTISGAGLDQQMKVQKN